MTSTKTNTQLPGTAWDALWCLLRAIERLDGRDKTLSQDVPDDPGRQLLRIFYTKMYGVLVRQMVYIMLPPSGNALSNLVGFVVFYRQFLAWDPGTLGQHAYSYYLAAE